MLEVAQVHALQRREEIVAKVVLEIARGADDDAAHQEPEEAAHHRQHEQRNGVLTDLAERQRALEVVDGVLEKPRPRQREHVGDDDTGEAEQERTPVFGEIPLGAGAPEPQRPTAKAYQTVRR